MSSAQPPAGGAISYMPRVWCLKCNRDAVVQRVLDSRTNRRTVVATCHGQRQEVAFATEPGQQVKLWG